MSQPHAPYIRHPFGITTVDAEYFRPGFASVHVIQRDGRAAIVDAGANSSVPLVLNALTELGIELATVDWLILTHVHLDHAGGAGLLLQQLPAARVVVHPRGAPHLIDPQRLQAASIAVYGAELFAKLYGDLLPIAAARVQSTVDGEMLRLGSSELTLLHTPGHAMHHQVLFDRSASAVFTGDTFGLSYREMDTEQGAFILPTTTPTQFDPEQLLESVRRVAELEAESVYLTHFGRLTGVERLAADLRDQIQRLVELARAHASAEDRHSQLRSALRQALVERAQAHGVANAEAVVDTVLGPDIELNTQGLIAWLERSAKRV